MLRTGWSIARASVAGTSHGKTGAPCQDASDHLVVGSGDDEILICVVCDGAGSAAHSEVGSALAAQTFTELVGMHFEGGGTIDGIDRRMMVGWLNTVGETLSVHAEQFGRSVRDYACTLLGSVVAPNATVFVQVGDGAIVVTQGAEDGWSWVFWPQHGEFANTTNFVTSADLAEVVEFDAAQGHVSELALFSDGIENLVLHNATKTVHGPFFDRVMMPLRRAETPGLDRGLSDGLRRYLDTPQFNERTDDDKTLVLASRRTAAGVSTP